MFSFLSSIFTFPVFAGGALAGSIPIIIHLLNKQRFKKVVWSAMHWLWASYKKSRRRLQIEQLILLAIRVLVLVLLALALARPAVQQAMGMLGGRGAVHRVIVLDNSYSMGQRIGGGPLFDKAKRLAQSLVKDLTPNDDVDIILANNVFEETIPAATKTEDMLNQINAAATSDGGTDIPKAIASACKLLIQRPGRGRPEIIVITDQTRNAWENTDGQPRRVKGDDDTAINTVFGNPRLKPKIAVVRLAGDKDQENVAAVSIEVDEKVVPTGVDVQFLGSITSFSPADVRDVKVKLMIDGEEAASEVVGRISPHKPEPVIFHHAFAEAGSHAIWLQLDSDVLAADNTAWLAIDAEDRLRVLCVDGKQRVGPNASETDYFRQALSPEKAEEVNAGKMPLFPEVIGDSALAEANLDNYRLVVLANIAQVPKNKIQALEGYVKRGGALWIFLGDRVDPAVYNQSLGELLPATIGEPVGADDPDGPREKLSDKETDYPAITKFRGIKGLPLSNLETWHRFKLLPRAANDPSTRPVLAYENGDWAAVERRIGDAGGRVLLIGTTANKAWNNWPSKNHYMPLMNYLALELIQPPYGQRNRMLGERFTMQISREEMGELRAQGVTLKYSPLSATVARGGGNPTAELPGSEASRFEILTEQFLMESGPIHRAGIFEADIPGQAKRRVHFAANRNLEESDLSVIEDREILAAVPKEGDARSDEKGFFGSVTQADLHLFATEDPKLVEDSLKTGGGNKELWKWLAGAVLVLLLAESFLARRFGNYE